MNNAGWEIRPLGWLASAILVAAIIYYLWKRLQRFQRANEDKT